MLIRLRELELKDAQGMYEWMTDTSITQFFRFDSSKISIASCVAYIKAAQGDEKNKHYAIVDEFDVYLGTISLKEINETSAEYAISTRKCVHGKGVALQATKEILNIAFCEMKLNEVYLNVLTENKRANNFYLKAGFRFQRCEKNAIEIRGDSKDLNWYSINRFDYLRIENEK